MSPDELVLNHLGMAHRMAAKAAGKPSLWKDDFRSAAVEGLVEASRRFDPDSGIPFSGFAYPRIAGSIRDEQRRLYGRTHNPEVVPIEGLEVVDSADPASAAVDRVMGEQVMSRLGDDDQLVRWYYFDEVPLREIGRRIGMSESGVSLKLKAIRERLAA